MIYFKSDSITIRRQKSISGIKYGFSATGTVHQADIQPMEGARVIEQGGQLGKMYEAFVDASVDVKENDQIRTDGVTYSVQAVSTYQGAGLLDHKMLTLMKQD